MTQDVVSILLGMATLVFVFVITPITLAKICSMIVWRDDTSLSALWDDGITLMMRCFIAIIFGAMFLIASLAIGDWLYVLLGLGG